MYSRVVRFVKTTLAEIIRPLRMTSDMKIETKFKEGLESVTATSSDICYLDGDQGVLAYCGYDIHDLASSATFEETCFLLWHRRLPTRVELGELQTELAAARPLPEQIIRMSRNLPRGGTMDILRTLTSALSHFDIDADDDSLKSNYRKAVRLTAQVTSLVATVGRLDAGGAPIQPDPALGHAANFLYMLTGERPGAIAVRAFDTALVLHADHELNASTFAARVTAATLSDIHSAVVAGISALKGSLHGGANADVMQMLLQLGEDASDDHIVEVIQNKLSRKEKIPGFGHRVYKNYDPRATIIRQVCHDLLNEIDTVDQPLFDIAMKLEEIALKDDYFVERKLYPNVDFYSASTYYALGIPIDLFVPIFAVSRISGWTAHILEQYGNNRLIRPRAEYIGPEYPQQFVELSQR